MSMNLRKLHFMLVAVVINLSNSSLTFAQLFQTTSSFSDARFDHCIAQSTNDKVLIFGGSNANGFSINSVFEYDPSLNLWSSKAAIPTTSGLSKSTSVKLNNGKILLFGGSQNGAFPQSNKVFEYSISSDSWATIADLPNAQGREQMESTLINDSIILITGGISTISSALNYPNSCYVYNINSNTFLPAGNLPVGVINHTSTLLSNGEVLITGGFDGNQARNEAFVFNLQTGWRTLSTGLSMAVSAHEALLVNGKVYIYGGFNIPLFEFSNNMDVYDPTTDEITSLNTGPLANSKFAMVHFGSNILIAGGNKVLPNTSFGVTNEAYLYNINNNSFSTLSTMPSARSGMECTQLGTTGKFIFSGGHVEQSSPFDDAIIFDANTIAGLTDNNVSNDVQLYPNPCQNQLNFRTNSYENKNQYVIYNSLGQMMLSDEQHTGHFSIDTSELPEGFYLFALNGASPQSFLIIR